jgi:hypothetical protein
VDKGCLYVSLFLLSLVMKKNSHAALAPMRAHRLSAVGNRVSVFDLVQNTSHTLPFENNKDIARLALSPNGVILLSVDVEGRALLINLPRKASDTVLPCGPATNRAHCGHFLVTPQHIAHAPLVMSICTWPTWRKYCLAAASRRDFLSR